MTYWKNFRSYPLTAVLVLFSLAPAFAQTLLQIKSPVAAASFPLFTEGQTYTITLSADPSVHKIAVLPQSPLGDAKPTSNPLEFALALATNIPPGIYSIGAIGFTSGRDVESAPVLIDVERADTPYLLTVLPVLVFQGAGEHEPIEVWGTYRDGTKLWLSNSTKLSYHSNDTSIVTVSGQLSADPQNTVPLIAPLTATSVGAGKYCPGREHRAREQPRISCDLCHGTASPAHRAGARNRRRGACNRCSRRDRHHHSRAALWRDPRQ